MVEDGGLVSIKPIIIGDRKIGQGEPIFIIAEAGVNHNGDIKMAKRLVKIAAEAGADAVKFQTFKAERIVSASAPKAEYQKKTTDPGESQLEMIRKLELTLDDHIELNAYCRSRGVLFLSTPFDNESADLLEDLGVPLFKIGSGEITNLPFLKYVAGKKRPIILSTGMSFLSEVDEAVRAVRGAGCDQLVLLHCVSNYPANPADSNLRAMKTMTEAFHVPLGYSDHTPGIEVALAVAALGAVVIEKHFTLDRTLTGPDHRASLEPKEFSSMIKSIRLVEEALGDGIKQPKEGEMANRVVGRRSIASAKKIMANMVITQDMLTAMRPGDGILPKEMYLVVGKKAKREIDMGEIITLDIIE